MPPFPVEVARIQEQLQVSPGDRLLDLACGHGNFTIEWAKRAGPEGLVIGLDLSRQMLLRASGHVREWGLENVLLVRGDAHHLPLADGCLTKVNCSGGFHQFPNLPQALREIARVSGPAAVLTASTLAEEPRDPRSGLKRWLRSRYDLYFVPLAALGEQLAQLGFEGYRWYVPGSWFGYLAAQRGSD
jgi:demethylmenaquinone methyltransferase/2-methoxy-6-polyprenyl-1,4-benzoquinol methylase